MTRLKNRRMIPAGIAAFALILRLIELGKQSVWMDEGYSIWAALHPVSVILTILHSDQHPPLFYLFTHFWLLGGHSEFYLRVPAAVCGTITAVTLYCFGKKLFGESTGVWTGLFWAAAFVALEQETQVRMYAPAVMLSTISSYLLWNVYADGKRSDWLLYFLSAAAALYTHYYCGFVILAQLLFLFSAGKYKTAIVSGLVLSAAAVPQIPTFLLQYGHHISKELPVISGSRFFIFLSDILGFENLFFQNDRLNLIPGIFSVALIGFGWSRLKEKPAEIKFMLFLWLVPSVIPFLISRFSGDHIYVYRYVVFFTPYFFMLLTGSLTAILRGLAFIPMLFLIILNLGLWTLFIRGPAFQRQNWRAAAQLLRRSLKNGDAVFVEQVMAFPPLWYYLSDIFRLDWSAPASPDGKSNLLTGPVNGMQTAWYGMEGPSSLPLLVKLAPKSKRQWVILCQSPLVDPGETVLKWFFKHRHFLKSYEYRSFRPGNEIFVYLFNGPNKEKQRPEARSTR